MWPWDHLAVGYLTVTALLRLGGEEPPDRPVVIAAVVGSLGPDLVDKPLAWVVSVLPSGVSLAHSALTCAVTLLVLWLVGLPRRPLLAFGGGYVAHLAGDAAYGLLTNAPGAPEFLLWPLLSVPPAPPTGPVVTVTTLFGFYRSFLASPAGQIYLLVDLLLFAVTFGIWIRHGTPGLRP